MTIREWAAQGQPIVAVLNVPAQVVCEATTAWPLAAQIARVGVDAMLSAEGLSAGRVELGQDPSGNWAMLTVDVVDDTGEAAEPPAEQGPDTPEDILARVNEQGD